MFSWFPARKRFLTPFLSQNTTLGGDPITSYVYTTSGNDPSAPPLGLVSSETNPDGDVTAYSYDAAGSVTATYQGQMVAFSAGSATFNNLPESPGLTRTFNVYVNSTSAPGSGQTTITDSDSGSPAFSFSGSSVTPLGSNWYLLGTVTLAAGDLSSTVTVAYSGGGTVSQVTLLEQTSATVYDGQENPLSVTDALGNVSATTFRQSRPVDHDLARPERPAGFRLRPCSATCRKRPARTGLSRFT